MKIEVLITGDGEDMYKVYRWALAIGIRQMRNAKTVEEALDVWQRFKKFQNNNYFILAKDNQKKKLLDGIRNDN